MGSMQSHEEQLLQRLYQHYKEMHGIQVKGGDDSQVVGGYSALQDYGNSVFSKAKEDLIRGLAKDVSSILGFKGADSSSLEAIIKKFKEVIPKPGTGKGSLKADSTKHAKLCELLAKAINKRYGMEIINEHAEPHVICHKVAELMYSLFTGLHTEFINIAGDVSRIVKNLEILQGIVDSANQKIMLDLGKTDNLMATSDAENTKELYKKLSDEIRRQHVLLSNLINSSIGPVGSNLITILSDNKDFTGLVEDLKQTTGAVYFGDKLSHLLTGISDVAHSANLVNKALKDIGLSVSDYKNVHGLNDLRRKVYDTIAKKHPSSEQLHKMLVAADILYRNDLSHDDIATHLSKKGGDTLGGAVNLDPSDPSFADMVDDATWQDNTSTPFSGRIQSFRRSVGKQIRDQRKYRNMLFTDLNEQIKSQYSAIIVIISKISQKVGGEIEASDKLERFIRLLNSFAAIQPDRKNLHIALSGYRTDANSNFIKYQFMDYLDLLKSESEELSKSAHGVYFKELANCIGNLIHIIDNFNSTFTNTLSEIHINEGPRLQKQGGDDELLMDMDGGEYGGEDGGAKKKHKKVVKHSEHSLEMEHEMPSEHQKEMAEEKDAAEEIKMIDAELESESSESSAVVGGNDMASDVLGGVIKEFKDNQFKHFLTLKKSIREMDYYFRIASIKGNLRKASIENKANVENYENILGEEAGWLIDQINQKYNAMVASANGTKLPVPGFDNEISIWTNGYDKGAWPVGGAFDANLKTNFTDATALGLEVVPGDKKGEEYRQGYLFLMEYIRTSKIEMLEAAQAIDLYLSKFTQNIEQDPDTIKNFVEIIENLEVVAKWFTDKSGNDLVGVFEAFASATTEGKGALGIVGHNDYSLPAGINAINAYTADQQFIRNDLANEFKINGNHYYEDIKARVAGAGQNGVGMFYKPRLMTREQAINFVKQLERSFKGVRSLENIINIFNKLNVQSTGEIKTFMNVGMIFKALMKYCVASVIGVGYRLVQNAGNVANSNLPAFPPVIDFKDNAPAPANDIDNNHTAAVLVKTGITLRFSNEYVRLHDGKDGKLLRFCDPFEFTADLKGNTSITDKIFEMSIKSMVSKIFIVIGSYSLFNRPPKGNQLFTSINASFAINPLRQIMGGSEGGEEGGMPPVQVISDALELYIRLPLLVEWYRKVFEFNRENTDLTDNKKDYNKQNSPMVSIIPEMDNIWRDLCFTVMIEGESVKEGAYPSELARKIILAITEIYKHYKAKKSNITCKEIIQEFVFEINRRYGFMLRSEIKEYLDTRDSLIKASSSDYPPEEENVDYDLLNANDQLGRKPAPSDRFRGFTPSKAGSRNDITLFYNAVRRFRQSVEANLLLDQPADPSGNVDDFDMTLSGDVNMDEIIRITKMKLEKASTPEEKYLIVHGQLHGVNKFSNIDQNKLLVFHETVVNPLTLLYFVYLILNDYNKLMVSMNLEKWDKVIENLCTADTISNHLVAGIGENGSYKNISFIDAKRAVAPGGAAAAGTFLGNIHNWLGLALLEQNNNKFKGDSKQIYGFHDTTDNFQTANKEGLFNLKRICRYFTYGSYLAPSNGSLTAFGQNTKNYLASADVDINNLGNISEYKVVNEVKAIVSRLGLDRQRLLEDVLRSVMNLSCELNGLVDVYFSGESKLRYPSLNFDKLEEVCNAMFQQAKQSLSKMRKSLPAMLINKFDSATDNKKVNAVSLFYIQEQLFDRLFKNKYGNGLNDGNDGLKNIWNELTREHKFNFITHGGDLSDGEAKQYKAIKLYVDIKSNELKFKDLAGRDQQLNVIGGLGNDPRAAAAITYAPGVFPIKDGDLIVNLSLYDSLHHEYCYDSYGTVLSKLLFWDQSYAKNRVLRELGFRQLTQSADSSKFPAHYLPLFRGGDSFANPKTKIIKEVVAPNIPVSNVLNDKKTPTNPSSWINFNSKIAMLALHTDGVDDIKGAGGKVPLFNLFAGFHNLYDYNTNYSNITKLTSGVRDKDINLGINDGTAFDGDETELFSRLGLLPKLNNIIYKYMELFIDKSNKKIYKPLIEKFINGYNSKDILQAKNINDRAVCRLDLNEINNNNNKQYPNILDNTGAVAAAAVNSAAALCSAVCQLEPPEQAVLFASLASAIQSVYNSKAERTIGSVTLFTEENFANVSEYQKELMRAYLPIFEKQLEMLIKRTDFLRNVIDNTSCKVYKWRQHYAGQSALAAGDGKLFHNDGRLGVYDVTGNNLNRVLFNTLDENDPSYTQPLRVPKVEVETARKTYLIGMAADITSTAKSLLTCINSVQKELSDVPLFFETYKDSIIDFNNRNNQLPVMPLSIMSHLMNFNLHRTQKDGQKDTTAKDNTYDQVEESKRAYHLNLLVDNTGVGSSQFKFAYGTRGILSHRQKPLVDYAPGVSALLDYEKLGGISGGAPKFDKASIQLLVENSVLLSRFILDYSYHTQYLDQQGYNLVRKLLVEGQLALGDDTQVQHLSCQTSKFTKDDNSSVGSFWSNTQNVVMMAENDNIRQSIYRLISCLRQGGNNTLFDTDRKKMQLFNILDLNLVPINFHSLQREIPFINLMNYSHTFDHLVKQTIGVEFKGKSLNEIHGLPPAGPGDNGEIAAGAAPAFSVSAGKDSYYLPTNMEQVYSANEFYSTRYPEDHLVRHLMYPLGFRRLNEYANHVYRIMAGDTSLSLNRPKYLSDQLWNKVLLNILYYNPNFGDPSGLNESRRIANKSMSFKSNVIKLVSLYAGDIQNDSKEPLINGILILNWKDVNINPVVAVLSYIGSDGTEKHVYNAPLGADYPITHRLGLEGYLRYNTRLVRWIEWPAQIQRIVRILMRQQLEWIQDPIVYEHNALAEGVTEFSSDNRGYILADFE